MIRLSAQGIDRFRSRATPKQSRKKSALTLARIFGVLIEKCALLLSFFYFKAGADKLVNLIWDEQVTFAELSIDVIIWISIQIKRMISRKTSLFLLKVGLLVSRRMNPARRTRASFEQSSS